MELSLIESLSSLGVGAIFGLVVFFIYRRDRIGTERMWRESKKFTEDRLTELLEQDQKTREANTKALTELNTVIMRLNSH